LSKACRLDEHGEAVPQQLQAGSCVAACSSSEVTSAFQSAKDTFVGYFLRQIED
jgi:hypothetical protein